MFAGLVSRVCVARVSGFEVWGVQDFGVVRMLAERLGLRVLLLGRRQAWEGFGGKLDCSHAAVGELPRCSLFVPWLKVEVFGLEFRCICGKEAEIDIRQGLSTLIACRRARVVGEELPNLRFLGRDFDLRLAIGNSIP